MQLNYSLNSGFATGDGSAPTRDNVSAWIAWAPAPDATTLYLAPRAMALNDDTVLLGVPVGDLDGVADALAGRNIDPQQLSYGQPDAHATVEIAAPIALEQVKVVVAKDGPTRRKAQREFAEIPGERQFHIIHEFFEQ